MSAPAPYLSTGLGFQSTAIGTAGGTLTVPAHATRALVTVSGAAIRYRTDGTAATATSGLPVHLTAYATGTVATLNLDSDLTRVSLAAQSGTATLDVLYGA